MAHKNDYSVIVFDRGNNYLCKIQYSHNLYKTSVWLSNSQNYNQWHYMNVYDRRTGHFLQRIYRNDFIPAFL